MVNQKIEDLVDVLAENYFQIENSFVMRNNEELAKGIKGNLNGWRLAKENGFETYKKMLVKMSNQITSEVTKKIEKIYLLSYRTIDRSKVVVTATEIYGRDLPKSFLNKIKREKVSAEKEIMKLANNTYKEYVHSVKTVNPSFNTEKIYNAITKQMSKGIENGIKIAYRVKSGKRKGQVRNVSFKSYMEMKTRTDVSHEITKQQIRYGANAGLIFYMVDSFADCAKDHQKFQGKLYYNARIKLPAEAKEYIQKHNLLSMQEVSENEPYLTTRPNCRHAFHVVPTGQILKGNVDKYKEDFTYGKMKTNNYKLVEQQRKNERLIRKYKMLKEDAKILYDQTKDKNQLTKYRYYKELQMKWTRANNELISSNKDFMKRNKAREDSRIIVNDLGVRNDMQS